MIAISYKQGAVRYGRTASAIGVLAEEGALKRYPAGEFSKANENLVGCQYAIDQEEADKFFGFKEDELQVKRKRKAKKEKPLPASFLEVFMGASHMIHDYRIRGQKHVLGGTKPFRLFRKKETFSPEPKKTLKAHDGQLLTNDVLMAEQIVLELNQLSALCRGGEDGKRSTTVFYSVEHLDRRALDEAIKRGTSGAVPSRKAFPKEVVGDEGY